MGKQDKYLRIYSRVTPETMVRIDAFAEAAGLTRAAAITVLVFIGLRYAGLLEYTPAAKEIFFGE